MRENNKDKRSGWKKKACVVSLAVGGLFGGIFLYNDKTNRDRQVYNYSKSLEDYTEKVFDFSSDPSKPTLYVIFQRHTLEGHGFSEDSVKKSFVHASNAQVSIYRILDYLYKNRDL